MSNQLILWSMFFIPWLTLFFMKKEDIKRFMPVALLTMVLGIIIVGIGETLKLWVVIETPFPLRNLPHILGLNPVITMWLFRFTYRRFWLFLVIDIMLNLGFAYLFFGYFMTVRGIFKFVGANPFHVFLITTVHGILLYGYLRWQDGIYAQPYRNSK